MREKILTTARDLTCGERDESYGQPVDNLTDVAAMWSTYLQTKYKIDLDLTAEDVAWMNVHIKIARSFKSFKEDNYVDAAAYAAIAGECRGAVSDEGDDVTYHKIAQHDELSDPMVKQK